MSKIFISFISMFLFGAAFASSTEKFVLADLEAVIESKSDTRAIIDSLNLSKSKIYKQDVSNYVTKLWESYSNKEPTNLSELDKIIFINVADFISLAVKNDLLQEDIYADQVLSLARQYIIDSVPDIQGSSLLILGRSDIPSDIDTIYKYVTNPQTSEFSFRIAVMSIISRCVEASNNSLLSLSEHVSNERYKFISDNLAGFKNARLCHG